MIEWHLPPYFSTKQRKRYLMTSPMWLLGTIQASSHLLVASSTIAHIGNPIWYSLPWLSPNHRSWIPIGCFGTWWICFPYGSCWLNASGACRCMMSETNFLTINIVSTKRGTMWDTYFVMWILSLNTILFCIVSTPCCLAGSQFIWSRTSCSLIVCGRLRIVGPLPASASSLHHHLMELSLCKLMRFSN